MAEVIRRYEAGRLTSRELERARRELRASLALARPGSPACAPIVAQLNAVEAAGAARCVMNLTPGQLARIGALSDEWSFLWDKRRSLWTAAEDCPDGVQVEEADLDVLLARLPVIVAGR